MGKKRKKTLERNEGCGRTQLLNKLKCIDKKAKQFVIGCNAVLRALERDQLEFVATSRDINSVLSRPISMLCAHHSISLLSLEPHELADLDFKINRLTAFGIKKTANEVNDLKKLIQEAGIKNANA